jgi:hypothetical protein
MIQERESNGATYKADMDEVAKLIQERARRGQSVAEFCRERELHTPYFFAWRKPPRENTPVPWKCMCRSARRSREGPKEFLKGYTQVLLTGAYGGYNGVVADNAITRRLLIPCETKVRGSEDNGTGGRADRRTVCGGTTGQRHFR